MKPGQTRRFLSKRFPGFTLYHELFNEFGKERVLADLIAWPDAHMR